MHGGVYLCMCVHTYLHAHFSGDCSQSFIICKSPVDLSNSMSHIHLKVIISQTQRRYPGITPGSVIHWLCNFRQIAYPHYASIFSFVTWRWH